MTSRRGSSHVRPRPPSSGRTSHPIKAAAPDRHRVRQHRGLKARRRRAPLVPRTLLALSVALLAGGAFLVASGGIGPALTTLAAGFSSAFARLGATPIPSQTYLPPTDSPRIAAPEQPFTNQATVDMVVSVPIELIGDPTARIRFYLALEGSGVRPGLRRQRREDQPDDRPVRPDAGPQRHLRNPHPGTEESEQSPVVTWILDLDPPKITVSSPKDGACDPGPRGHDQGHDPGRHDPDRPKRRQWDVHQRGVGQGRVVRVRPAACVGQQHHPHRGDRPGRQRRRDDPDAAPGLRRHGRQPERLDEPDLGVEASGSLQLVVVVTDPTGTPLGGATAFFTLQLPGLAPISNEVVTSTDGRAVFTTPLVGTLTPGGGIATVLVTHALYGQATDRVALTFVK